MANISKDFSLIRLLVGNRTLSVGELCSKTGLSTSSFYRKLGQLRELGLSVSQQDGMYCIDAASPLLSEMVNGYVFGADEARLMTGILAGIGQRTPRMENLRRRLSHVACQGDEGARIRLEEHITLCHETISRAIRERRIVKICQYVSNNSRTTSDRIVEPYMLLHETTEVRCYELSSHRNKTFRLSRMGHVELLDLYWSHEADHRPFRTDLFHFSGEESEPVRLRLGPVARQVLIEEYPEAARLLVEEQPAAGQSLSDADQHAEAHSIGAESAPSHWILDTQICSHIGAGRFVMGISDDVEVLTDGPFRQYLRQRAENFARRLAQPIA